MADWCEKNFFSIFALSMLIVVMFSLPLLFRAETCSFGFV